MSNGEEMARKCSDIFYRLSHSFPSFSLTTSRSSRQTCSRFNGLQRVLPRDNDRLPFYASSFVQQPQFYPRSSFPSSDISDKLRLSMDLYPFKHYVLRRTRTLESQTRIKLQLAILPQSYRIDELYNIQDTANLLESRVLSIFILFRRNDRSFIRKNIAIR